MPTVREITDPLLSVFTPVPEAGEGICDVCHNAPREDFERCYSCFDTTRSVSRPVLNVVPVSLYVVSGQLHKYLRWYKDGNDRERSRFSVIVAAIAGRFIGEHGDCIMREYGAWDVITSVPSIRWPDQHPLERALRMVDTLDPIYERLLTAGPEERARHSVNERAYNAASSATGKRVLLVDDTYTSGASLQSAASALASGDAEVVAAVVLGRVIDPNFNGESRALWEAQSAEAFRFDRCCLE